MSPNSRPWLLSIAMLAVVSCAPAEQPASISQAVIDGVQDPTALGFTLHPLEQNAVLTPLVKSSHGYSQGCTGTLVGDRVVVSAAHCVVLNQEQWIQGAEPEVAPPTLLSYGVGTADAPLCILKVESVNVHPQAKVLSSMIEHDLSVSILESSAVDQCPQVVPLQINREPDLSGLKGKRLLQGGYGSLDLSYDFSPKRFWSALELTEMNEHAFILDQVGEGFPSYGDSGSAALYRFDDGSLRHLGVVSTNVGDPGSGRMLFVRLDDQAALLDSLITPQLMCGDVTAAGRCVDTQFLMSCGEHGFALTDCGADGGTCETSGGTSACKTPAVVEPDAGSPDAGVEPDALPLTGEATDEPGGCALAGSGAPVSALLPLLLLLLLRRKSCPATSTGG